MCVRARTCGLMWSLLKEINICCSKYTWSCNSPLSYIYPLLYAPIECARYTKRFPHMPSFLHASIGGVTTPASYKYIPCCMRIYTALLYMQYYKSSFPTNAPLALSSYNIMRPICASFQLTIPTNVSVFSSYMLLLNCIGYKTRLPHNYHHCTTLLYTTSRYMRYNCPISQMATGPSSILDQGNICKVYNCHHIGPMM